jgi:hypothetical protein
MKRILSKTTNRGQGILMKKATFLTDCSSCDGQMANVYEKVTGRKQVLLRKRQSNVQN